MFTTFISNKKSQITPGLNLDQYDVVGYRIISPLHLAALLAYSSRFISAKKPLKILVVVSKGPWENSILSCFSSNSNETEIDFIDETSLNTKISHSWAIYLTLNPIFTLLSWTTRRKRKPLCAPTMASLKFVSSSLCRTVYLRPVVLDEGIGSFNAEPGFLKEAERRTNSRMARSFLVFIYRTLWSNLELIGAERITLFKFNRGQPIIDNDIATSYKITFLQIYKLRNQSVFLEPNTALILTQPLSEMGICSEAQLLNAVTKIANEITSTGANPIIKTHPAESKGKYNCLNIKTLDYEGAVEEIYAGNHQKIKEVWGFHSTALITASALYELKAKSVKTPWLSNFLDNLDSEAKALYKKYTDSCHV